MTAERNNSLEVPSFPATNALRLRWERRSRHCEERSDEAIQLCGADISDEEIRFCPQAKSWIASLRSQ
jgi:hypothetical protein